MSKLEERRATIRTLVHGNKIRTQQELADKLRELDYDCTQATISRDISEMELGKSPDGYYMLPEDLRFLRIARELVEGASAAGNLVVVKTRSGSASTVGEVLDNSSFDGLVGSVAGDNTILIVAKNDEYARLITTAIEAIRRR